MSRSGIKSSELGLSELLQIFKNYPSPVIAIEIAKEYAKRAKPDFKLALEYYKFAADNGDGAASFEVAYQLEVGKWVPKDAVLSLAYLKQSADQGYREAQYSYAMDCIDRANEPTQTLQNREALYREAFANYVKAASQGHPDACVSLAVCYLTGIGVAKDEKRAKDSYKQAYERALDENDQGVMQQLAKTQPGFIISLLKSERSQSATDIQRFNAKEFLKNLDAKDPKQKRVIDEVNNVVKTFFHQDKGVSPQAKQSDTSVSFAKKS